MIPVGGMLLLSALAITQFGAQGPGVLTLDSCLAIAEHNATAVQTAQASVRLSGMEVLRRHGEFLPNAVLNAGYQRQDGTTFLSQSTVVPTSTRFTTLGYSVSTTLNVFNGLSDRAALKAALEARDAASFSLLRARQQVAYDVTQAYLQAILDRQLVRIAEQILTLSETREAQLVELVNVGRRAPPDLYRQQAQTAADRVAVVDAKNRQRADEILLLRRLRLRPDSGYQFVEPPADTTRLMGTSDDVPTLIAEARGQRADLRAAEARALAADLDVRRARGGYLPKVNVGLAYFGDARVFDKQIQNGASVLPPNQNELWGQLGNQSSYALAVGVTWNIFDRFATKIDVERARLGQTLSRLAYEDLQLQVDGEVRQAEAEYQAGFDRLAAAHAGIVAADTAFAAVAARYETGLASFVDVITTQTQLAAARAQEAQALVAFTLSKRVLALALGLDH